MIEQNRRDPEIPMNVFQREACFALRVGNACSTMPFNMEKEKPQMTGLLTIPIHKYLPYRIPLFSPLQSRVVFFFFFLTASLIVVTYRSIDDRCAIFTFFDVSRLRQHESKRVLQQSDCILVILQVGERSYESQNVQVETVCTQYIRVMYVPQGTERKSQTYTHTTKR